MDFLGRAAVRAGAGRGRPRRRLVSFVVDDPEPMLWGGELVLRDGVPVGPGDQRGLGRDASARCVGLAHVADPSGTTSRDWAAAGDYAVDVGGSMHPMSVTLRAPYDPGGERVRLA